MAVNILPDAQDDLLALQEYMLDQWGESEWLEAENEIFEKLEQVDTGNYPGTPIQELVAIGVVEFLNVFTSHHRLVFRRIDSDIHVYAVAGYRQDFPFLLSKRLSARE